MGALILIGAYVTSAPVASGANPEIDSDFKPTIANDQPAPAEKPRGMVWIPGGEFSMGAA